MRSWPRESNLRAKGELSSRSKEVESSSVGREQASRVQRIVDCKIAEASSELNRSQSAFLVLNLAWDRGDSTRFPFRA